MSEKRVILGYKSDLLFKWALSNDDEGAELVRKTIISQITKLPVKSTKVMNPQLYPNQKTQYEMRLDILVQLDDGTKVDIEMQNTRLSRYAIAKSEAYLTNVHGAQIRGSNPEDFHETHQIVFINAYSEEPAMMSASMKMQDDYLHKAGWKIKAHYVYLPYIDEVVKSKGVDGLDVIEAIYYTFQNIDRSVILKLSKKYREVAILMEKQDLFNRNDDMYVLALQRWYAYEDMDHYKEIMRQEAQEDGLKQGKEEGLKQGKEEGLKQGKEEGLKQGKEEGLKQGKEEGLKQGKEEGLKQGKEEGLKQGKEEGLKQGQEEGLKQGKEMFVLLRHKMMEEGRIEEFLEALEDDARLEELYKVYHLNL